MGPARAAPGGGAAGSASPSGGGAKQRSGGALAPAAAGPGGGEAARCEHQQGQAALVRAQAGRGAARAWRSACGGGGHGDRRRHGAERARKLGERGKVRGA